MLVRQFSPDDAERLSRLIIRNLRLVNIRDYSPQVIEALIPSHTPECIQDLARYGYTLVGIDEDVIVGTASLDGDLIRNVFVDVEKHGNGVGRKLMATIETYALDQRLHRIYLRSGLTAVGFYHKLGYTSICNYEHDLDGVPLQLIKMEKELTPEK
jgi:GNAT superfamily N-acetyltransferase